MSQKVAIMFMKNYFRKFGTSFGDNHAAPFRRKYADRYRENRDRLVLSISPNDS